MRPNHFWPARCTVHGAVQPNTQRLPGHLPDMGNSPGHTTTLLPQEAWASCCSHTSPAESSAAELTAAHGAWSPEESTLHFSAPSMPLSCPSHLSDYSVLLLFLYSYLLCKYNHFMCLKISFSLSFQSISFWFSILIALSKVSDAQGGEKKQNPNNYLNKC